MLDELDDDRVKLSIEEADGLVTEVVFTGPGWERFVNGAIAFDLEHNERRAS